MKRTLSCCLSSASLLGLLLTPLASGAAAQATAQAAGAVSPSQLQEVLVSVSINGSPSGEPVVLLRGADGALYAPHELLSSLRLKLDSPPAFSRGGIAYHLLSGKSGLKLELAEATQTLALEADPRLLEQTRFAMTEVDLGGEMVRGTGAFLNYEATGQLAQGLLTGAGAIEAGLFTSKGVGLTGLVGRWTGGHAEIVRLDTNWTIDDPRGMRSLRFGDSISRGGVGGVPMRFGGIQLARNFAVQPGFVTIPLPSVSGSAALPSVVDVYVDGALRDSRDVPPGPFEIADVPIVGGAGDVQVVVRDLLGREVLYSQSYYAAPRLLQEGLHDYSYELGFLRRSFGRKSNDYGPLMASGTHRYGFSDSLTGEVHAEASKDVQTAGVAANAVIADVANVAFSIAGSRSELGAGALAAVTMERRSRGLSLGVRGEFTTNNYMALGWSSEHRPPASVVQAFAGMPIGSGSVGLSYLRRDSRSEPDAEYVSANASLRVGNFASLHLAGRKDLNDAGGVAAELLLTMPFGPQQSSSAGVSLIDGKLGFKSTVQRNLPVGQGFGYQVVTSAGAVDRMDGRLSLQTGFGLHDAQLTWTDGRTGVRFSTAGGVGTIGGDVFASRRLDQSFAMVKVGEYQNVRVYTDNQLVGRTDRRGTVIVPKLRPFDRNRLKIEVADLPMDADVSADEQTVRPYDRHGVVVDFAVSPSRAALIRVLLADGSPLPAGSLVKLAGQQSEFVSAPGGEVYLTGLGASNVVVASWSEGSCRFLLPFVEPKEPQVSTEDFQCLSNVQ